MQASVEMDEGLRRLKSIIEEFPADSSHWNEAQNRFQFIDRLMIECLGWSRPDMKVEDSDQSGGRADYVLGNPPKAVLEAKKESKPWSSLPTGNTSQVRKIKPLILSSKNFEEVVTQVIPYCSFRGAPIAIVCNGPQLAIFQAFTPGQNPLDGECYFFNGFETYIDEFALLWTLLSPEGITENRAFRDLARYRNPRIPPKASQSIPEPNRYRYRDNVQEELRALGSLLLDEIEDNPDLKT
jgi:predicted type IV restriction endonuclease